MLLAADFRKIARDALSGKWGIAIGTGFVASLFLNSVNFSNFFNNRSSGSGYSFQEWANNEFLGSLMPYLTAIVSITAFLSLISFFFRGAITLGYCRFNKNMINNTNPEFNNLFSRFDIFLKAFGMQFLINLYTFLWSLLFIIPGIIASLSYAMTPYILEENPTMGINEAIRESKEMMQGNKWRLFCLGFSFIGWIIICGLTLGIGYLWISPYINAAKAAFYYDILDKSSVPNYITE